MTFNKQTGALVTSGLLRQSFLPIANIFGGFLFGLGIVMAGGCASGIVYRLGEGQVSAIIAIFGFLAVVLQQNGLPLRYFVLLPWRLFLKENRPSVNPKRDIHGD
jgi:uncharacterized membrane protein YedE/YeeE